MSKTITLGDLLNSIISTVSTVRRKMPQISTDTKTQKSPSECSILVVDNSHGYIYVENLGGYIPIRTSGDNGGKKYIQVGDGAPIVPDPTTLVIDDGAYYSARTTEALRLRGYGVDIASSGLETIDMLRKDGYDLLIIGLQVKHSTDDEPTQEEVNKILRYALKHKTDLGVILATLPEQIEPITPDISQILADKVQPLQKPYAVSTNGIDRETELIRMVRDNLGIKTKR